MESGSGNGETVKTKEQLAEGGNGGTVKTTEQLAEEADRKAKAVANPSTINFVKQIENAGQQSTKMLNNNEVEKRRSSEQTGQINNESLSPAPIVAKSSISIEPTSEREPVVNLGTVFNENNAKVNKQDPNDQVSMSSSKPTNTGQKNDKVSSTLTLKTDTNTNIPNPLAESREESKTTEPTLSTATAKPTQNRSFNRRSKFLTTYNPNTPKNFLRKSKGTISGKGTRKNSSSYVKEGNLQEYGKQLAELTSRQIRALSTTQIMALSTAQIAALPPDKIPSLTTAQIKVLSEPQTQALTTDQIKALTYISSRLSSTNQIQALNLEYLTDTQTQALTPEQIKAIGTPQQIRTLKIDYLTKQQIQALTQAQIDAIFFEKIPKEKFDYLKVEQFKTMSRPKIQSIQYIDSLSEDKINAIYYELTIEQKKKLTAEQKKKLTAEQKKFLDKDPNDSGGGVSGVGLGSALGFYG